MWLADRRRFCKGQRKRALLNRERSVEAVDDLERVNCRTADWCVFSSAECVREVLVKIRCLGIWEMIDRKKHALA